MKNIKKELQWFLVITLTVTYSIGFYALNRGGLQAMSMRMAMYVPATVVLLLYWLKFKKAIFKNGDLGFRFSGWKYWIIAPALMTFLSIASYLISWGINPLLFSSSATIKELLIDKGFYFGNIYFGLIAIFLLNGIVGSILNIPMFLGEELGWRGFMTPRLISLMKPQLAFLTGGIFWALWHVFMIAGGLNYPGHFIGGIFMMILMTIPMGIIIQYYYFRSRSIFVAALAHAALNKSTMSISFVIAESHYNSFLYGPTGIIGIVLFYLVALFLYRKINWREYNTYKANSNDVETSETQQTMA